MGLDYLAAEWLAGRVARDIECAVTPVIPVGFSRQWMAFPGTLSLRRDTVAAVMDDIVKSLIRHGIDRVLIINGHGRNSAILNDLCLRVRYETGCPDQPRGLVQDRPRPSRGGRAGPACRQQAARTRLRAGDRGHARACGGARTRARVDGSRTVGQRDPVLFEGVDELTIGPGRDADLGPLRGVRRLLPESRSRRHGALRRRPARRSDTSHRGDRPAGPRAGRRPHRRVRRRASERAGHRPPRPDIY